MKVSTASSSFPLTCNSHPFSVLSAIYASTGGWWLTCSDTYLQKEACVYVCVCENACVSVMADLL